MSKEVNLDQAMAEDDTDLLYYHVTSSSTLAVGFVVSSDG